jgi:hypothetical protein
MQFNQINSIDIRSFPNFCYSECHFVGLIRCGRRASARLRSVYQLPLQLQKMVT